MIIVFNYLLQKSGILPQSAMKPIVQNQQIRGCDPFGCGHYGASRGGRSHKGVDIIVTEGQTIKSPISGKVTRYPQPYAGDARYKGIEIVGDEYKVKIFYVVPTVAIGTQVTAGTAIATAQDISEKYGDGMTNHAHLEVYTKSGVSIDPAPLFT